MSIESTADWKGLRQAAHVARLTLDALAQQVQPGVTTGELDDTAVRLFAAHGARSAPAFTYGFPRTVLIRVNDEISWHPRGSSHPHGRHRQARCDR